MKKKIIAGAATVLLAFVLLSATLSKSSSGAPASHTGAPGEMTCATSGCHDDNEINKGTASLSLEFGSNETSFKRGQTYPIKVKIADAKKERFGFQLVALDSKSQKNSGEFKILDSVRTQIVANRHKLTDRKYLTYKFNGTDATGDGFAEWTVYWTAPEDSKKAVTFYLAGVSGNDDMTDKGDKVYTANYTIKCNKGK
jgi:hypothetical protein